MSAITLESGGPFDLASLALRLALDLASAGLAVRLDDRRTAVAATPIDSLGLAPHHAAGLVRAEPATAPPPGDWRVGPPGLAPDAFGVAAAPGVAHASPGSLPIRAALPSTVQRAGPPRVITPWCPTPIDQLPPLAPTAGTIALDGLRLGSVLTLTDLAGAASRPDRAPSRRVHPTALAALLDALALAAGSGAPPELVLDEATVDGALEFAPALARWPGSWRLVLAETPDATAARALGNLRCARIDIVVPAPGDVTFPAWTGGASPDAAFARLAHVPADSPPIELVFATGAPGEGEAEQRQAVRRLRSVTGVIRRFGARPFAPRPGSPAALDPAGFGAAYVAGQGPHGWIAGHDNDAWRRKLAAEYQIAAESLGLPLRDALPLGRDMARHRSAIARRLSDPLAALPSAIRDDLELVGVLQGERAYRGPGALEIDLTNDCNNTCVGCWCHSLQMGDARFSGAMKRQFLETDLILTLLDDAWGMGTRKLQLAGSGEPFMHPDVMKILAHAKQLGFEVTIVTNLNFITRDRAERLIDLGVDQITASVWAGTPAMYVATHPNQTEKSFERLRDVLGYLWARKRELGRSAPLVKMYHVISHVNCREIEPMIELAVQTGCEQVELQITDIVPGRSDSLALDDGDRAAVIEQLGRLAARAVDPTRTAARGVSAYAALDQIAEARQFGKFEKPTHPGWTWADPLLETMHCPRGNEGSLPVRDFCDPTETRYYYFWSVWDCHRCPDYTTCPIDKTHLAITKEFTELVGLGSFYRRVASMRATSAGEVRYEESIVDRVPCTIGWTYSRVRVSGEVIPCCKGHLHPLGDLHRQRFGEIWFGAATDELRRMGKHQAKAHPYFERIRCYKACDNVGQNLETQHRLERLDPAARAALERAAPDPAHVPAPGEFVLPKR